MFNHSMRYFAVAAFVGLALSASSSNNPEDLTQPQQASVSNSLAGMPLAFTKNMGQWPDSIMFRASANGATMWFTKNGIWYQFFRRVDSVVDPVGRNPRGLDSSPVGQDPRGPDNSPDSIETTMIKAEFIGASEAVDVVGMEELEYKCNYFLGNDHSKWRTDVPNFSAVTMRGLYPGVDVTFSAKDGRLQEELIASTESDLEQVRIEYRGERVSTPLNATSTPETGLTYEDLSRLHPELACPVRSARVEGSKGGPDSPWAADVPSAPSSDGRQIASATSSASGVNIVFSTYLGGSMEENCADIAVDAEGNAYVSGITHSADFPTLNPLQPSFGQPAVYGTDAFVTKLSPEGGLVYSTFLGGNSSETGSNTCIAVDGSGSAYVAGFTNSPDFPRVNSFDPIWKGHTGDAFVAKLSPAGNSLTYCTFLGGSYDPQDPNFISGKDDAHCIAVDETGSAYVAGVTHCLDFPTINAYDDTRNGESDGFVAKFSPAGDSLVYSTYLGGSYDPFYGGRDEVVDIAVDAAKCVYVTGITWCHDFPTQNPYDSSLGGSIDCFVSKLSQAGDTLVYSTFLGGNISSYSGRDVGYGIAVDGAGSAYVAGITSSPDFPTHNPLPNGGGILKGTLDVFVTKFSPDGHSLTYSTFFGGSGDEASVCDIALGESGSVYVMGFTRSIDFPTVHPFQGAPGGESDAFVAKLSTDNNSLIYSSYLGGSNSEVGIGHIALDGAGNVYVTGRTLSSDFPTVNPFDGSLSSPYNAFVTKVSPFVSCCVGSTGNIDCDPGDGVDISDLSALIDHLYITFTQLCCSFEANVDGQNWIDISDLTALIDYLYISFTPPAACQ